MTDFKYLNCNAAICAKNAVQQQIEDIEETMKIDTSDFNPAHKDYWKYKAKMYRESIDGLRCLYKELSKRWLEAYKEEHKDD